MNCETCGAKAVMARPGRCKEHFIEDFERRVHDTIKRFTLIQDGETICVAASGGKDSLALLHVLKDHHPIEALSVDEGIAGYRDQTLDDLRSYCDAHSIPLRIVSFEDLGAKRLDAETHDHPCSVCGVLRRKALLEYAHDYDLLATGHNLDDEAQTILMNLLRNNDTLNARIGPRIERGDLPARIKPFYLTPEREVRAYCLLQGITTNFSECPNVVKSFRWRVGEHLSELERDVPGAKRNIVERFLQQQFEDDEELSTCPRCNGPSSSGVCQACSLTISAAHR